MAGARTVTLAPPTDYGPSTGLVSITISEDSSDPTRVRIDVVGKARDAVTGVEDVGLVATSALKSNATLQAVAALAIAAWKAAKGY